MTDLSLEISTAFTATQVILVFVIFLFTLFYPDIQRVIREDSKEDGTRAKNKLANKVKDTFWGKGIVLILSSLLVFCLFLPVFHQIIISLINNWNYDYGNYSFILVFIFSLCFLIWSIRLSYDLSKRIKELKGFTRIETVDYLLRGNKKNKK